METVRVSVETTILYLVICFVTISVEVVYTFQAAKKMTVCP